ncbi:MAG: hypothetical protein AAF558_08595, partial [Verrucomicrobiota bacterium]
MIRSLTSEPSWKAQWIAPEGVSAETNIYFRARTVFEGGKVAKDAVLHIAADSYYKVYLNGETLGSGPARGTITRIFYDSYSLKGLLSGGDNWLSVLVCCHNDDHNFKTAPAEPAVLMQVDNGDVVATAKDWFVQPAPEWKQDVRPYTPQMGFMEWRDFRSEPVRWKLGQDGGCWSRAREVSSAHEFFGRVLMPRDIPPLDVLASPVKEVELLGSVPNNSERELASTRTAELISKEEHLPTADVTSEKRQQFLKGSEAIEILPQPNGCGVALLFDFKKEFNRGIELEIKAPEGVIVDIAYEEELKEGRVIAAVKEYYFADRYITRKGQQVLGTELFERGGRLIQVVFRNFDQPIEIIRAEAVDARFPAHQPARFESSDPFLNQLWNTCQETLHCCATDTFTDCPWRESAFWVNDMVVENVLWLQGFGQPGLSLRCLKLALSQADSEHQGLIPGVCPSSGNPRLIFPATNLFLGIILEEYWLYSGDESSVRELYPQIREIVDVIGTWRDESGIVRLPEGNPYWNFVDWAFDLSGKSLSGKDATVISLFYVLAQESLACIEKTLELGRSGQSLQDAEKTMAGVFQKLWDSEAQVLKEWFPTCEEEAPRGSRLTHALAGLAKCRPEKYSKILTERFSGNKETPPELYLFHFVFRAMKHANREDEIFSAIKRYWGPIIERGSPTIWEANVVQHGKQAFDGKGSLCHGFATTPIEFMQRVILGISPLA